MEISTELLKRIETEKAGLTASDFRRAGSTATDLVDILTQLFANAHNDTTPLIAAGMPDSYLDYCDALLQALTKDLALRYGTTTEKPEERLYFDQQYSLVQKERRYMLAVVSHIADRCGDKKVKQNYKHITQGTSVIDTLNDVLALAVIINKYPAFAAEIRPNGVTIDTNYCTQAENRAADLLKLKGYVVDKGLTPTNEVDQLNRTITLCVKAQAELKKFAYAAFIDDPDHYERNYIFSSGAKSQGDVEADNNKQTEATVLK